MNGKQRVEAALMGIFPDKRPVMLHNFMMAIEESEYTMAQFRKDPEIAAKVFIQNAEKYDLDGILVDFDTATLAGACGMDVDLPEHEPARVHKPLYNSLEEINDLEPIDISKDSRVQIWLETSRLVKKHFGDEKFVRSNCDQAPFSLASMLRSPAMWMMDILMEDPLADKMLDYCTDICTQFISLTAQTGVDMVSNGDSVAGPEMISPEMFERYALPSEQKVVARAHKFGLPYMLHICGNTDIILDKMIRSGANSIELDYKTDINKILTQTQPKGIVFSGNIDPSAVIALGTPEMVEEKTVEILNLFKDNPYLIINAGCAIPAQTPSENIERLINVVRNY